MATARRPHHAHISFDASSRATADRLHRRLSEARGTGGPPVVSFVGAMRNRPVGPHPVPQFEIHFHDESLPAVIALLEASGLTAPVHPLTDDDVADHTSLAHWIGELIPLDLSVFPCSIRPA